MATVHVVGAGLAGLACAVRIAGRGRRVALYDAAPQAGGRCRSYVDRQLGRTIDNGNHLLLSGNRAALAYLAEIGATDRLIGPSDARFPFLDLGTGERWIVRPNDGPLPWWILRPGRRVPGTRPGDYRSTLRLLRPRSEATVREVLGAADPLFVRFWEPLTVAALNAAPDHAAARLLGRVVAETFARGGRFCRPLVARDGLSASFVDPALDRLRRAGAAVTLGRRLTGLGIAADRVRTLDFADGRVALGPADAVVLAVPPQAAAALLPGLGAPDAAAAIVNAHFVLPRPPGGFDACPFLGLLGGTAQWLFVRAAVVSVTVSAAGALADAAAGDLLGRLWRDVAGALDLDPRTPPPGRLIKERRATFAQTPGQARRRPGPQTPLANLVLAGDWTDTGLPASIEGAVRSGHRAAALV